MGKPYFWIGLVLCAVVCSIALAQDKDENKNPGKADYDAELAKSLGADEYGMKSYVLCVLKTGKQTIEDQEKSNEIFRGHFANMARLSKDGKLVLAGPLIDAKPKRGIYIFNVTEIQDAENLVKTDPAVKAGVFDYELTKLYCSAALMKISQIHGTIQKTEIK